MCVCLGVCGYLGTTTMPESEEWAQQQHTDQILLLCIIYIYLLALIVDSQSLSLRLCVCVCQSCTVRQMLTHPRPHGTWRWSSPIRVHDTTEAKSLKFNTAISVSLCVWLCDGIVWAAAAAAPLLLWSSTLVTLVARVQHLLLLLLFSHKW